jgi:hypothetical protein
MSIVGAHASALDTCTAVTGDFDPALMSRHAIREASRERIPLALIRQTYDDSDGTRSSTHDELREIRTRWFGEGGIEVVVDVDDRRVVTVWRKGRGR